MFVYNKNIYLISRPAKSSSTETNDIKRTGKRVKLKSFSLMEWNENVYTGDEVSIVGLSTV